MSSCELPDNWREEMEADREEWDDTHSDWQGGSLQSHLNHMRDLRYVVHTEEWYEESELYELYHDNRRRGWDREQLMEVGEEMGAFRGMTECWWSRQTLAYLMRARREPGERLLTLVGESIQLTEPNVTARNAFEYAQALAPATTHTSYWWLAMQAVKLNWQVQQLAPGLTEAMRRELRGEVLTAEDVDGMGGVAVDMRYRVPLLGYTFIRHGDKASEAPLFDDSMYHDVMSDLAQSKGLWTWYIGAERPTLTLPPPRPQ